MNPKVLVFGEDVGRKGGVHLVTEGLQKQFGVGRVFDTSLSEEGIIGRAVGMADRRAHARGRDSVPEVRGPGARAAEQLRHHALADGQPVLRADRGAHAGRLRQGRRRSVALS